MTSRLDLGFCLSLVGELFVRALNALYNVNMTTL